MVKTGRVWIDPRTGEFHASDRCNNRLKCSQSRKHWYNALFTQCRGCTPIRRRLQLVRTNLQINYESLTFARCHHWRRVIVTSASGTAWHRDIVCTTDKTSRPPPRLYSLTVIARQLSSIFSVYFSR